MNRAATIPGDVPAHPSGGYPIVTHVTAPPAPSPLGAAERIVTNPVIKLMAGIIAGLLSLICAIMLSYITLTISAIDKRQDTTDSVNAVQASEIRDLQNWQIAQSAGADTRKEYTEFLKNSQAQGAEFVDLIRDIRDRLPELKRK